MMEQHVHDNLPQSNPAGQLTLFQREFVKIEKDLTVMGIFSASYASMKSAKSKTVALHQAVDGKRGEVTLTIIPSALYGLPTTAHQDKLFAFLRLLEDRREYGQPLKNPIGFKDADLLRQLGKRITAGKNYNDIDEWLDVMSATTIKIQGAFYLGGQKKPIEYGNRNIHLFEQTLAFGQRRDDGSFAEMNYVWLSEWLLGNLENFHTFSLDWEAYKRLTTPIAKTMLPVLHTWFNATARQGGIEKRYDELCAYLGIEPYRYPSQMKQRHGPALDELVAAGYLRSWELMALARGEGYKLVLAYGTKFYEDRKVLEARKQPGVVSKAIKTLSAPSKAESMLLPATTPDRVPRGLQEPYNLLLTQGFDESAAAELCADPFTQPKQKPVTSEQDRCERIKRQCDWIAKRLVRGSKLGMLRRAIEQDWNEPPSIQLEPRAAQRTRLPLDGKKETEALRAYESYRSAREEACRTECAAAYQAYEAALEQKITEVPNRGTAVGKIAVRILREGYFTDFFKEHSEYGFEILDFAEWRKSKSEKGR